MQCNKDRGLGGKPSGSGEGSLQACLQGWADSYNPGHQQPLVTTPPMRNTLRSLSLSHLESIYEDEGLFESSLGFSMCV